MNKSVVVSTVVLAALAGAPSQTEACGEGQFNMGQGMRYQAYLAPRPATVLVYDEATSSANAQEHANLYRGLQQAGHRVTVVRDAEAFSKARAGNGFEIIIADFAEFDHLATISGTTASEVRMLPVVERKQRNAPELRSRFEFFLVDGASLGQYLKVINQALVRTP